MSDRLKRSLSEVLTDFYPLAGRFSGNTSVDCNDNGLEYIEAQVKAPLTLNQLFTRPNVAELNPLFPNDAYTHGTGFEGPLAVQVTVFDACGGMAIGVSLSHGLADGASCALFVNRWAATARQGDTRMPIKTVPPAPLFNFASLFPPRDNVITPRVTDFVPRDTATKLVTKRFVFSQLKIDALKGKFEYGRPTRVEVVSAVVFKCLVNMSRSTSSKSVALCSSINLHTRMSPPSFAHYLGNVMLILVIKQIGPETETSLNELGMQFRKSAKEIDSDYLKRLQANNALVQERLTHYIKVCANENVRVFRLSSVCKFPWDEADFGWGAPTWAGPIFSNSRNLVMLVDASTGDGIEALVTLEEDDMKRFQSQLLDFTAPDPIVSKL